MWLQGDVPTKHQQTRLDSFNQLIGVFRQLTGQTVCVLDSLEQKTAATRPLWNSLEIPAVDSPL